MKPIDHALDRLFRAAAQPPLSSESSMPAALESRILNSLRSGPHAAGDDFGTLMTLFRRGFAVAALVAAVTVLACLRGNDSQMPAMDSMVLDSVAQLSLLP